MNTARMEFEPSPKITKEAFEVISKYVNTHYGINLTDAKRNLVENRLFKRLRLLRMSSYTQYINHIFNPGGKEELDLLCDFLSTNKTYFYREPAHFDFVQSLLANAGAGRTWKVWSAACSAGDEVYTLACVLEEANRKSGIHYNVLGTDISMRMIEEARKGSYPHERIRELPSYMVKSYFDKVEDKAGQERYHANAMLRRNVRFQSFNLIKDIPGLQERFDIIFCRNVLIYFKDDMKRHVVRELVNKLTPGGYLILAHCEAMLGRNTGLKQVGSAIYLKEK